MNRTYYVVPQCFAKFAENPGVIAFADLLTAIERSPEDFHQAELVLFSGLCDDRLAELKELLRTRRCSARIELNSTIPPRAPGWLVHKRNASNVCVSEPVVNDAGDYVVYALIDDRCAEMSDHLTGQHVPGILLIEAARQAMMISVETALFPPEQRGSTNYVLSELDIRYLGYAFPVDLKIHTTIVEHQLSDKNVLQVRLYVRFLQGGKEVCKVSCLAAGYPKAFMDRLEGRAARLVAQQLDSVIEERREPRPLSTLTSEVA